jgi:hypothetical protein
MKLLKSLRDLIVWSLIGAGLLCAVNARAASPYVQGLWTKGNPIYVSEGTTMMPSSLAYDRTFTDLALFYHPLSAGSLWDIPWIAGIIGAWWQGRH